MHKCWMMGKEKSINSRIIISVQYNQISKTVYTWASAEEISILWCCIFFL